MLPPITIPELDPASPVDPDNDQLVIRQGLNDKKVSPAQISSLRLQAFPSINRPLVQTDVLLIGANNGDGTYTNYRANPARLGFLNNVTMWFFTDDNAAPLYWTVVPGAGDRVLAIKGGANIYSNAGFNGGWQQADHTLTVDQMPKHRHSVDGAGAESASGNLVRGYRQSSGRDSKPWETKSAGGTQPHNHGNSWRPAAAIGVLCQKTG